MNVKKLIRGTKMEIALKGKFDTISASTFESEIVGELTDVTELVIDMSNVEYISSAGLRVLLYLQQIMDEQGSMAVKNVPEAASHVFRVTGFDKVITIL